MVAAELSIGQLEYVTSTSGRRLTRFEDQFIAWRAFDGQLTDDVARACTAAYARAHG